VTRLKLNFPKKQLETPHVVSYFSNVASRFSVREKAFLKAESHTL
jgi:hypothetical protein